MKCHSPVESGLMGFSRGKDVCGLGKSFYPESFYPNNLCLLPSATGFHMLATIGPASRKTQQPKSISTAPDSLRRTWTWGLRV